jgi:hypothetical protein
MTTDNVTWFEILTFMSQIDTCFTHPPILPPAAGMPIGLLYTYVKLADFLEAHKI